MFGTFRYNNSLNEPEYVELSRDSGVDARGYTLLACQLCRARKLKCSGDRGGCSRCLASSSECTYGPDGDGYGNSSTAGTGKGASRRRRHIVPSAPSTNGNQRPSTTTQHDRMSMIANGPSRPNQDVEDEDGGRRHANDENRKGCQMSPSAPPDPANRAPAHAGFSSDVPPGADSSIDLFDFNDFTDFNGESGSIDLSCMNSPIIGTLADAVSSIAPGPLPALPQPPNTPACVPSTTQAAVAVHESPSPLTARGSRLSTPRPPLEPTRPGGGCQCLTSLAGILERLGRYRLGDKPKTASNLDCLLFCLGSGVSACNKALSCKTCDACEEHSILLATIAKQLAHVCNDLCGCLLVHQHKVKAAAGSSETTSTSTSTSPPSPPFPGDPGSGDPAPESESETLVDGDISFGRYRIQGAEMRLRLIQNLMALHMTDLLALLEKLTQRIGQVDGATGMLADAKNTTYTAHWMLQRLRSEP